MSTIIIANARILTLRGSSDGRRGAELSDLGIIENGWLRADDGVITAVEAGDLPEDQQDIEGDLIDAGGSVLMPTFVDCHTHACWAGNRFDEFEARLRGQSYLDALAAGGGIMATVRAVREAHEDDLAFDLTRRLTAAVALGTGAIEIKSGYGLATEAELKMLRAVHSVSRMMPLAITGTFLGAHALDPDNPNFVDETIEETLPAVVQEFPGVVCDAYCEDGAWSLADTQRLFAAATELGCPLRVHADQFNSLGMTLSAIEMGAISVDHLEATTEEDLQQLAESATFGVMLPCSGFTLDGRYANGRRFVDQGGLLAVATNYNPGSAPSPSVPFTIALACRSLGLTPAEAISCTTWNAACVLGLEDRFGALIPGYTASFQLLDSTDERELAFEFATAGPLMVVLGGRIAHTRAVEREEVELTYDEEDDDDDESGDDFPFDLSEDDD